MHLNNNKLIDTAAIVSLNGALVIIILFIALAIFFKIESVRYFTFALLICATIGTISFIMMSTPIIIKFWNTWLGKIVFIILGYVAYTISNGRARDVVYTTFGFNPIHLPNTTNLLNYAYAARVFN